MSDNASLLESSAEALQVSRQDFRFAGVLERLLYIRVESILAQLPAHELMVLAQHSRERSFDAGDRLVEEGTAMSAAYLLVKGSVSMRRQGTTYRTISAPGLVGFTPLLSRDKRGVEVVAKEDLTTLEISEDVLLDLVADNFDFLAGALRGISGELVDVQRELEIKGLLRRSTPESGVYPASPLDFVQRLSMMRKGVYSEVNLESLIELINNSREVRIAQGEVLWEVGDASTFTLQVMHGVIACSEPNGQRDFRFGSGSAVGALEANASRPRSYRAVAETPVVAIRTDTDRFFDVLEDHSELGMGLLAFLSTHLVELQVRVATSQVGHSLAPLLNAPPS